MSNFLKRTQLLSPLKIYAKRFVRQDMLSGRLMAAGYPVHGKCLNPIDDANMRKTAGHAVKKIKKHKNIFKSVVGNTERFVQECEFAAPRLDDVHYQMSNKNDRNYPQTWIECPKQIKVPKVWETQERDN